MDASGAGESRRDLVAIVDDEPLVLRAIERILRTDEHALATAGSLEEIDALLAHPVLSVVLLDLFLGELSGLDLLERIKAVRPDVEVVVMTGRGSVRSAVRCMRQGAFDYLCKPFVDGEQVRETVAAAREAALAAATANGREEGPRGPDAGWGRVPLTGAADPADVAGSDDAEGIPLSLDAYERLALERALREAGGDAREAARRLGIGRSTFYRKAAKLGVGIQREARRGPAASRRVGEGPTIG